MSHHIESISDDFWNIRGSFRVLGLLDVQTQCSLIRLRSGGYAMLDSYTLEGDVRERVLARTDAGRAVEAVINLHPFHTMHIDAMRPLFPEAKHYGTARHHERFSSFSVGASANRGSGLCGALRGRPRAVGTRWGSVGHRQRQGALRLRARHSCSHPDAARRRHPQLASASAGRTPPLSGAPASARAQTRVPRPPMRFVSGPNAWRSAARRSATSAPRTPAGALCAPKSPAKLLAAFAPRRSGWSGSSDFTSEVERRPSTALRR